MISRGCQSFGGKLNMTGMVAFQIPSFMRGFSHVEYMRTNW